MGPISKTSILALALTSSLVASGVLAQMTGDTYKIESDSVNMGGAEIISGSYSLDDTLGEAGTGDSESSNYQISAGYRQMQESSISLTIGGDIVMEPSLGGLSGGISNGSTTLQVVTDSPGGYSMTIQSNASPAMTSAHDSIDDYVPLTTDPDVVADYNFQTVLSEAVFGYSVEGADIVDFFRDDGSICGVIGGGDTSLKCWHGLSTTTQVISRGEPNQPTGVVTTLRFRVGIGGSNMITEGNYTATTTITAIAL